MADHFKTLTGQPYWLARDMLGEAVDADRIRKPLTGEAFNRELALARANRRLVAFYEGEYIARLSGHYQPGDEVWTYSDLDTLSGSAGYCLIRGDTAVAVIETMRA